MIKLYLTLSTIMMILGYNVLQAGTATINKAIEDRETKVGYLYSILENN